MYQICLTDQAYAEWRQRARDRGLSVSELVARVAFQPELLTDAPVKSTGSPESAPSSARAREVRHHIDKLIASGMYLAEVATGAGMRNRTAQLRDFRRGLASIPVMQAERILALTPDDARTRRTAQHLAALAPAFGGTRLGLSIATGITQATVAKLLDGVDFTVSEETARRVFSVALPESELEDAA